MENQAIGMIETKGLVALVIATDPLEPTELHRIARSSIVSRNSSPVSIMPEGLLNTLSRDEILDLLAYLETTPSSPP